jgi:hypothetical protein
MEDVPVDIDLIDAVLDQSGKEFHQIFFGC